MCTLPVPTSFYIISIVHTFFASIFWCVNDANNNNTAVSQKRAHGQYTLLCALTGGWADICNIAAFYHEKPAMFTLSIGYCTPTHLPSTAGSREAMNQSVRNCVQQRTAKAHHRNLTPAAVVGRRKYYWTCSWRNIKSLLVLFGEEQHNYMQIYRQAAAF